MDAFANNLIDALDGTTAVSRKTETPPSTVHSWRKNGIPRSRLAHLRLVAEREGKAIDWESGRLVAGDGGSGDHAAERTEARTQVQPHNARENIGAAA